MCVRERERESRGICKGMQLLLLKYKMGDFAEFASKNVLDAIQSAKTMKMYEDEGFVEHFEVHKSVEMDGTMDSEGDEYDQKQMIEYCEFDL